MARKRKNLQHLDYESSEYWNKLLAADGLSLSAGLNLHKLSYVGDSQKLVKIQEEQFEKGTGRVVPKKRAE